MWKQRRSYADYIARFPVQVGEYVQVGRGNSAPKSLEVWGRNSFLVRLKSEPEAIWTQVPDPAWTGFALPLSWRGEYSVDGTPASANGVFFLDGGAEFTTRGAERDIVVVGVRRATLAHACSSLTGADHWELGGGNRLLNLGKRENIVIHQICRNMMAAGSLQGPVAGRMLLSPAHEVDIISAIATWLVRHVNPDACERNDKRDQVDIVKRAKLVTRVKPVSDISLADLCASSGVGKTRLHQAFIDVHGVSPGQYLKLQRLSSAREAMLDPVNPPRSVKDATRTFGFYSSGRFAREYLGMFGELPSQTLHRSRVNVA